jgi:prolyl-tRNA editing enzyme YbaK/EbsC (Cys-tRNA(Pro) deacylase)
MKKDFGNLQFISVQENLDLLAKPVANMILQLPDTLEVFVSEIDPTLSDTVAFCEKYEIPVSKAANCVILEAKRADKSWLAAAVVLASTRADVNGLIRRTLDARRVSFAPMEQAVNQSGMEYGAITPIGLPFDWTILIDKAVADNDYVIVGSGLRKSKLLISGKNLTTLQNVKILENLGLKKE